MADAIEFLLDRAARYPLLTAQQEIQLGRQIREWLDWDGGPEQAPAAIKRRGQRALDKFLLCNLRLAHFVSKRFHNRGVSAEDLMQCATEGLITACKKYQPRLGFRFTSYAVWWAQQACQVEVAKQGGGMRLPTTVSQQLRKMSRAEERLRLELQREPSPAEIEEAAGLKAGQLSDLRTAARQADTRSIHAGLRASGDTSGPERRCLGDALASSDRPDERMERRELSRLLLGAIEDPTTPFTPQQRLILRCRYLLDEPMSLPKIAGRLNMSKNTVRRLELLALEKLRALLPDTILAYRALL